MTFPYEDIVSLPHPVSSRHARMTDADRAAQFSPFAALNGHAAAIDETARLTDHRAELAEDELAALNEKLRNLAQHLPEKPIISVTCFVPDPRKSGGAYVTLSGVVKKIDTTEQKLVWENGSWVDFRDIFEVSGRATG